jgi:hypothetical protein
VNGDTASQQIRASTDPFGHGRSQTQTQITQICAVADLPAIDPETAQNGGSRAMAVTSDRHAARLVF